MVRRIGRYDGEQIEVEGVVSVRYDDSGRVVIGQYDIIVNGQRVRGDDHIGFNPNNFEVDCPDYHNSRRGDRVRVRGRVVRYVNNGYRDPRRKGHVNFRFEQIDEYNIIG